MPRYGRWPLALAVGLVGILNILNGLSLPFEILFRFRTFSGIAKSLSALGGTIQVILGSMLVLSAMVLLFRMVSAWVLAVFLLVVAVGVSAIQEKWGGTLVIQFFLLLAVMWTRRYFNTHPW